MKNNFTYNLLEWHEKQNDRSMPWKGEKNPYKIWLSEIILQQTRVEQGWRYYEKFVATYPTVIALAYADDREVFKLWEGLGYYTRCKNLLHSARYIAANLGGVFPEKYEDILALKGVGSYTAAAIASFAFMQPYAVIDGNVLRVLARYFGEALPIDSKAGKDYFTEKANGLLYKKNSALFNQAIMDFGATVCKPQIPKCSGCIMRPECVAFKKGLVNTLPVKEKRLTKTTRWFYYFVFTYKGMVWVNKRVNKDIWQSLFEFYLFETGKAHQWNEDLIQKWMDKQLGISRFTITGMSQVYRQQLTHQHINGQFINIELFKKPESLKHLERVKWTNIEQLAFPKIINTYLEENGNKQELILIKPKF